MIKRQSWIQKKRQNDIAGMVIFRALFCALFCALFVGCLFAPPSAYAKDYSFGWSANPEPVEGYKLYYKKGGDAGPPYDGNDAAAGPSPIDIGKQTDFTISGLEDNTTYHFALSAYNGSEESGLTEIITVFPVESPSLAPAPTTETTGSKAFTFSWDATLESGITAHRFYINDQFLCQSTTSADTSVTCYADLLNETMYFSMTTVDSLGIESARSNILAFNPGENTTPSSDPTDATASLAAVISTDKQSGEVPLTIAFDAGASTGAIDSYAWTFGDGDTAGGTTASHTFQAAGTYTTTLKVVDTNGASQTTSMTITATAAAAPAPAIEPTAVIASSAGVGNAPFSITFDGSGSTTAQPPFVSYAWDFGDGTSASGIAVEHTYTFAGTFHPSLTVLDSAGLSNQISTPVLIGPPETTNQPPISLFTATPGYGTSPLTVSFNGTASSDTDGSIKSYLWSFGDGTIASGSTVQHTFTTVADYTVTLRVTDDLNATASSSTVISVRAAEDNAIPFELQEIEVDHNWTRFDFTQPFIDPVVVAGPMSFKESEPATIRVRNVDTTGCEIRIQEWEYLDGPHAKEKLSFIVMEKGKYTLDNGSKIEAGTFSGTTAFQKISLQQSSAAIPVILTQVISENETDAVVGRLNKISTSGFEYKMQERELTVRSHGTETIGYIAWEPGTGKVSGLPYEAGITAQTVNDSWSDISFQADFPDLPMVLADMQSYKGGETAGMRSQNLTQSSFQVKIEEEQSKDDETSHAAEAVGYLAIGSALPTASTDAPSSWVKQFVFTWESENSDNVTGYRIYLNNSLLCESTNPDDRQITCQGELANAAMEFTMTSVLLDGSESAPSVILSISPEDYPDLFGIRLVTFNWEYDSTLESSISGFTMYNNDILVCETTNPSDRQLTCKVQLDSSNNAFTIKAKGLDGAETSLSNALELSL